MKPYWCFADNLVAEATEKVAKLSSSLSKATDNTAFPNNTIGSWIQPISAFLEAITEVIALRKGDFADESQKTAHHQGNLATEPPRHLILCKVITDLAISLKSIIRASERLKNVLESPNRCIAYLSHY